MHKLSNRMLMNVGMIPRGLSVADIGCDHGFVSIYLIENGLADHVYAMDVAQGPLERATSNIALAGLDDKIELRLSDGVEKLEFVEDGKLEADVLLMAGIGGHLAVKLIEDGLNKCRRAEYIVLQPQSDLDFVRNQMNRLGFTLDAEDMVFEDGKYYTSMRFVNSADSVTYDYSEMEAKYGPVLIKEKNVVLIEYLHYKKSKFEEIHCSILEKNMPGNSDRLKEIEHEIDIINHCLSIISR